MKDAGHLSMLECGAYISMLRTYYSGETALSKDIKVIHRLVGAKRPQEKDAVKRILEEFFTLESDGYHQKRCDQEIKNYHDKAEKARQSAHARWAANAMRTQSERYANHKPLTINHKKGVGSDTSYTSPENVKTVEKELKQKTQEIAADLASNMRPAEQPSRSAIEERNRQIAILVVNGKIEEAHALKAQPIE
jgi:uncharacterized protein YdaU (DUF1376 family)